MKRSFNCVLTANTYQTLTSVCVRRSNQCRAQYLQTRRNNCITLHAPMALLSDLSGVFSEMLYECGLLMAYAMLYLVLQPSTHENKTFNSYKVSL